MWASINLAENSSNNVRNCCPIFEYNS